MKISVVLFTCTSPQRLENVLYGWSRQSWTDFEIIVADDGSDNSIARVINRMRRESRLPIKHVWQQDKGFRKCRILNKAILEARHDYILFSDGDCIPRSDLVETHAVEARQGHFLSGSYFKLSMTTSRAITKEDIQSGNCFDAAWLGRHGLRYRLKTGKLSAGKQASRLLDHLTSANCNFKGSNSSAWKKDILAVNGFDERMHWGGEDTELGVRLVNLGIRPKHVSYRAVVLHLQNNLHTYLDSEQVKMNKALRLHNEKHKVWHTDYGISNLEAGASPSGGRISDSLPIWK